MDFHTIHGKSRAGNCENHRKTDTVRTDDIIDLQETSLNCWRAKYQGNYGVYTIKIAFDDQGDVDDFSCSCPSNGYPCKHIPIVKQAITERIAESRHPAKTKEKTLSTEELLKNVSLQELRDFIVRKAKYNDDLSNAIKLEFAHQITDTNANPYFSILREALKKTSFNYEDYYDYEESLDLDVLHQWLKKAQDYAGRNNFREALLISKACIEEFAAWLQNQDGEIYDYIDSFYQACPFQIIKKALENHKVDAKELYDYCLSEMNKDKYAGTDLFNEFNDLLAILAKQANPDEFIVLQDSLLKKIADKSSYEAEKILRREIDFYNSIQQPGKANALIEKNIQIENFRYMLAEKRFSEQNFTEAKKLINHFLSEKNKTGYYYGNRRWNELLLEIARKENDVPGIRAIVFSFIEQHFDEKYFTAYKSTFAPDEWNDALEKILQHYEKNDRNFSSSVARTLAFEKLAERLALYVEKYLTVKIIEEYHTAFAASFPEKTLEMFKKAIDKYAEVNMGRSCYEQIATLLKQMRKIKNGDKTVAEMIARYRIVYRNRRAMMEILNGL
jgi:hypothetical protein